MKVKLWQRLVQAFLMAPADKIIRALLVGSSLLGGVIGALLGFSFFWSAYTGLLTISITIWWFARRARVRRERAAANTAGSVLATIAARSTK